MAKTFQKRSFTFQESQTPITELKTKFGGQPVWLKPEAAQWPIYYYNEEKMLFMGQIVLEKAIFPDILGNVVAYLFFADEVEQLYPEATAIVIQTDAKTYTNVEVAHLPDLVGKSIYELAEDHQTTFPKEYEAVLSEIETENYLPLEERYNWQKGDFDFQNYTGYQFSKPALAGNKIGGQAIYVEGLDTPPKPFDSEDWHLLLQLAPKAGYWDLTWQKKGLYQPNFYPFFMQMYSTSIISIFISKDYTQTQWFIQNT
ncbi:MAG: hypothetical protein NW226_16910 [Microscillaceae bacterium]|nr:hypothetical protein [Microscillaceae bacterium]